MTTELGQEIINRISPYVDVNINIINLNGQIVASTDSSRIGERHMGAVEVIKSETKLILNQDNVDMYPGTRPGVNLPINHHGQLAGVVGISGQPKQISQLTGLVRAMVEMVIDQLSIQKQEHYTETRWMNWLHQLLHPSGYDTDKMEKESIYSLNIHTDADWRVIVLEGPDVQNHIQSIRQEVAASNIKDLFTMPFLENEVIIAVSMDVSAIERLTERLSKDNRQIGVGDEIFGLNGIRLSYQQAKQALQLNEGRSRITFAADWKFERLTATIDSQVLQRIGAPYKNLLNRLGKDYVDTVDAYFRHNFSVKESARVLSIHRNTLLYRLAQVRDKTGLDPRDFHDACLLKILRTRTDL